MMNSTRHPIVGLCLAWMTVLLLPIAARAAITANLTIEPFGIAAGETKELVVDLQNPDDEITLVQFDLRLPEGLQVESDASNQLLIDMGERTTWRSHSLNANIIGEVTRFLLASNSNALVTGTEGALVKVTLTATSTFKGGAVSLENILLVTPEEDEIKPANYVINVGATAVNATLSVFQPAFVEPGGTRALTIELNNSDSGITLVQFDLRIPKGVSVKRDDNGQPVVDMTGRCSENHQLSSYDRGDAIRFLLASNSNAAITGTQGAIIKVWLTADNDFKGGTALLENILLVTPDQTEAKPANVTTDISHLLPDLTVTAKNYTITYGDELPQFEYTTEGSDLGGEPTVSCTATDSSPVGTYPINIGQGTVSNYTVVGVAGTLTIKKAPLTITADSYTRKQGEPNPTFTVTYQGFKKNETKAVLTTKPTVICSAIESSAPGNYTITVKGAAATNYSITYKNGTLTVTEADPVTITASSYSVTYGDPLPQFSFTSSGAPLQGTPSLSCSATSTSPVGEYDIVVSKGSVSNYNVTYVAGKLTITKAPLTIKAGNYTRRQGEENPEFTLTYEGFRNNETENVLTTKPTATCSATVESASGNYIVSVSGATAQNYSIGYVSGTLTVTPTDPVTITAKSYVITYGDELPQYEFTTSGAELKGTPVITCDATNTSPTGIYLITVSRGTVTNNNVNFVAGTLTINKAPLTITANDCTKGYYEDNPPFTVTYSGFMNGEDHTVLSQQPVVTTTATKDSPAGTYPITPSGAQANNYSISYVEGTLTIVDQTLYNKIGAADISIMTNDQKLFDIWLDNVNPIIMVEFYLQLPQGISIAMDNDGYPDVTLNPNRTDRTHSVEVSEDAEGLYHFLCYSNKSNAFKGNEGALLHVRLDCANETTPGDFTGILKDILMSDSERNSIAIPNQTFAINVKDYLLGDVNDNRHINGMDIVEIVELIMNHRYKQAADLYPYGQPDGVVNGMDLVEEVNLVMDQTSSYTTSRMMAPANVSSGMTLTLKNDGYALGTSTDKRYVLAQMTVELADGMELTDISSDSHHVVAYKPLGDNRYSVVVYSGRNHVFDTNNELLVLHCTGQGHVNVTDIMLADDDKNECYFHSISSDVVTGIHQQSETATNSTSVYTLEGILITNNVNTEVLQRLPKGVYIVGGRKTMVK